MMACVVTYRWYQAPFDERNWRYFRSEGHSSGCVDWAAGVYKCYVFASTLQGLPQMRVDLPDQLTLESAKKEIEGHLSRRGDFA